MVFPCSAAVEPLLGVPCAYRGSNDAVGSPFVLPWMTAFLSETNPNESGCSSKIVGFVIEGIGGGCWSFGRETVSAKSIG
jgi:hypothetical protein